MIRTSQHGLSVPAQTRQGVCGQKCAEERRLPASPAWRDRCLQVRWRRSLVAEARSRVLQGRLVPHRW